MHGERVQGGRLVDEAWGRVSAVWALWRTTRSTFRIGPLSRNRDAGSQSCNV